MLHCGIYQAHFANLVSHSIFYAYRKKCILCPVYIHYVAIVRVAWWFAILNTAYVFSQGEASRHSNWDQKHWRHLQLWRVPRFRHSPTFRYIFSQLMLTWNSLIPCCVTNGNVIMLPFYFKSYCCIQPHRGWSKEQRLGLRQLHLQALWRPDCTRRHPFIHENWEEIDAKRLDNLLHKLFIASGIWRILHHLFPV